jgi:hypothetical protein
VVVLDGDGVRAAVLLAVGAGELLQDLRLEPHGPRFGRRIVGLPLEGVQAAVVAAHIEHTVREHRRGHDRGLGHVGRLAAAVADVEPDQIAVPGAEVHQPAGDRGGREDPGAGLEPPPLLAGLRVHGVDELAVGAAGEDQAVVHRRRRDHPRALVVGSPALRPGSGVHRVQKAVARPHVDDAVRDRRRRLDLAAREVRVALGVEHPALLAGRQLERVQRTVHAAHVHRVAGDRGGRADGASEVVLPTDHAALSVDRIHVAVGAAEQDGAVVHHR